MCGNYGMGSRLLCRKPETCSSFGQNTQQVNMFSCAQSKFWLKYQKANIFLFLIVPLLRLHLNVYSTLLTFIQLLDIWSLFSGYRFLSRSQKVKWSEQFVIGKSISFGWVRLSGLERSSKVVGLATHQPAKDCKDQLPSNRWLKEPFKNLTQGWSLNNKEFEENCLINLLMIRKWYDEIYLSQFVHR